MNRAIKYGLLHCHTDNSLRDAAMTVQTLVKSAKELGAPAIALTDHGTMTGYLHFMQTCQKQGIKPIIGVEADVEEQAEGRRHLILMAKDFVGFQALIKAVTESNKRISQEGNISYPRMNKELLIRYFGPDSSGHGHVIATSACVSGILSSIILNDSAKGELRKALSEKQANCISPQSTGYIHNTEKLTSVKLRQKDLTTEIADLKIRAKNCSLINEEKKVLTAVASSQAWQQAKATYETALIDREQAVSQLAAKLEEKIQIDAEVDKIQAIVRQSKRSVDNWKKYQRQIEEIDGTYLGPDKLKYTLKSETLSFYEIFGEDFYIELQYHNSREEKICMPILAKLAGELNIPVCLSNNVHMPVKTEDEILARTILRATRHEKWIAPRAMDKQLYIKTDQELIDKISEVIPRQKVLEGYANIGKIVSQCNLEIPMEHHYPKFKTPNGISVDEYLQKLAYEGIAKRYSGGFTEQHEHRLKHELSAICELGYADYYCIVEDLLRYARAAGKLDFSNADEKQLALSFDIPKIEAAVRKRPGQCVGPGRGSAAGSLVCYLIGITNLDPIEYGLSFERFLNPSRATPPDIDCDLDTLVRPYVIEYIRHKYGSDSVCGIIIRSTNTGKQAIWTAGRAYGLQKAEKAATYTELISEICRKAESLSEDHKIKLKEIEQSLKCAFKYNFHASQIIRYALLIENSINLFGQHPAGIIICNEHPVDDYMPLCSGASELMISQCDKDQVEMLGHLKIDLLGLTNLTIINETLREIYENTGRVINLDQIPLDDSVVYKKIFCCGMTKSIFQSESSGMQKTLMQFKPESILQLALLLAMYRPGPLKFLSNVIAIKNGVKKLSYLTPSLEPILNSTYGSIIFQEQVQEIFTELAGYSLEQADLVRQAISKKLEKTLEAERQAFLHGDPERKIAGVCTNGISEQIATKLFEEIIDFGKYAFNKSHAFCYAVLAYQTAWLKFYYPHEYIMAVLNHTKNEKLPGLMTELHNIGIRVKTPDINASQIGFSLQSQVIYFGLGNVKGLNESVLPIIIERNKNGPYRSMTDFLLRVLPQKNALERLIDAGAFDQLIKNRASIKELIPFYLSSIQKIKEIKGEIESVLDQKRMARLHLKLQYAMQKLSNCPIDENICVEEVETLKREKDVLGVYVSKHPLQLYAPPEKEGAYPIHELTNKKLGQTVVITGIISDLKIKQQRKDGRTFAVFLLTDLTGHIEVCCFSDRYVSVKELVKEDAIIRIEGKLVTDKYSSGDMKIYLEKVSLLKPAKKTITIYVPGVYALEESLWNLITPYVSQNGNPTRIFDVGMSEFRTCNLTLNPAILDNPNLKTSLHDL